MESSLSFLQESASFKDLESDSGAYIFNGTSGANAVKQVLATHDNSTVTAIIHVDGALLASSNNVALEMSSES